MVVSRLFVFLSDKIVYFNVFSDFCKILYSIYHPCLLKKQTDKMSIHENLLALNI